MSVGFFESSTVKIPMNIMQTWKTNKLPDYWVASQKAIFKFMPHWKYTLMTDDDNYEFVTKYFPDFLKYFKAFEYPIQRADAIRYMWLYVHGGLYLDLDLEIVKCLDDIFYDDKDLYVVGSAILGEVYTNAFFAAKPKLKVMLDFLENMKIPNKLWHIGKHLKVVNSTGPMMFTKAINNRYASNEHLLKPIKRELIIPCTICDEKPCCSEGGYIRLLGGSSWSGKDTGFYTYLFCNQKKIIICLVLLVIKIIICVLLIKYYKRKKTANYIVSKK